MIVRDSCAGCGHALETVLDLGATPLANSYPLPGEPDGPSYPLQLAVCGVCWLAQQRCVPEPAEVFGPRYGFSTESPASKAYFGKAAAWAAANSGPGLAIDVGCNDGTMLAALAGQGRDVAGVEPSAAAERALERGFAVEREFLTRDSAAKITALHGRASLVTAFHVAAHVPDPDDFLAGIAGLLDDDGTAVVEFQSLADLVAGGMWDLVYHEHQFFYSLATFSMLAAAHGLRPAQFLHTPAQGGSWRVVLRRGGLPDPLAGYWEGPERWLRSRDAYASLQGRAGYSARRILETVVEENAERRTVAGYAASAKSCTLLNFCGLGAGHLAWVTDTTPSKAGRETPGSRIPIRAEGDFPDTFLLMAANHLPTVLRRLPLWWREAGGRLITPLPVPVTA